MATQSIWSDTEQKEILIFVRSGERERRKSYLERPTPERKRLWLRAVALQDKLERQSGEALGGKAKKKKAADR